MDESIAASAEAELAAYEPLFHRKGLGVTREVYEQSTADDFWEVGASGSSYDRASIWAVLEQRSQGNEADNWEVTDFRVRPLSKNVFLVTYLLNQSGRMTRRSTIWERADDSWLAIYHQGTLIGTLNEDPN